MTTRATPSTAEIKRFLNIILPIAILDAILLVPLVLASINDDEDLIGILGPIHGIGFLIMLALTAQGSLRRMWGWWFPAVVIVTAGPLGSIVGDLYIRKQLKQGA